MKTLAGALLALLTLSGCGPSAYEMTAPGAELPNPWSFGYCQARDPYGRCSHWSSGNGQIRPYDVPPPGYTGPVYPPREVNPPATPAGTAQPAPT